jgi:hypothetical protein
MAHKSSESNYGSYRKINAETNPRALHGRGIPKGENNLPRKAYPL